MKMTDWADTLFLFLKRAPVTYFTFEWMDGDDDDNYYYDDDDDEYQKHWR